MKAYVSSFLAAAAFCGVAGCQDPAKMGGSPSKADAPSRVEAGDQVVLHVEGMV